jgi:Lysyl oxidase
MRRRTLSVVTGVTVAAALAVAATSYVAGAGTGGHAGTAPPDAAAAPGERSTAAAVGSAAAPPLRPDVRSLRARDLRIRVTAAGRRLRFAAMLANDGPGPLVLAPRQRRDCPPGLRHADQQVHLDRNRDGRYQRRTDTAVRSRPAGCMLDHPTHAHWHFDAMAAYRLVDVTPRRRVVSARPKVSFCLRDNRPVPGTTPRQRRAFFGDCGRDVVQGISPGWVDLYDVHTPGQSVRLPRRMPDGVYCLVLRADPRDQLVETDETDNASVRPVRIRGNRVSTPQVAACRGLFR